MSNKLKKTSDFSDWNLVEGKRENSKRGCKVSYAFGPAINTGNLRKIFTKKQTKDMEKKYSQVDLEKIKANMSPRNFESSFDAGIVTNQKTGIAVEQNTSRHLLPPINSLNKLSSPYAIGEQEFVYSDIMQKVLQEEKELSISSNGTNTINKLAESILRYPVPFDI